MSGSEAFFEVRNEFYKDCSAAILVYDVTNKKSFDALPSWLEEVSGWLRVLKSEQVVYIDLTLYYYPHFCHVSPPSLVACLLPCSLQARKFGASSDLPIIVCANKVDKRRVVQEADGMQLAVANGLSHWDTSALSGANVADVFDTLFTTVLERPPYNVP